MADDQKCLDVIQINLRGSRVATAQLVQTAIKLRLDVLLVQDPYMIDGKIAGFPVGWFLAASLSVTCVVIVIDKRLQVIMADSFDNSVFVNITDTDSVLTVRTQYSAPSATLSDDLNDWERTRHANWDRLVIAGDFNTHDVAWGYSRSDGRGHLLLEHMTAKRLVVNNVVPCLPTYFTSSGIGSWPDVTFSSNADVNLVTDWEVMDEVTGSDHRYVKFRIKGSIARQRSKRFKTKVCNLTKFTIHLRNKRIKLDSMFRNLCEIKQLEAGLDELYGLIMKVASRSFRRKGVKNSPTATWWCPELQG